MRGSHLIASMAGLLLSSISCFAASPASEMPTSETAENGTLAEADLEITRPDDDRWDGRRYWYCNAAPYRWVGHWDGRDYEAFGRDYWRVHTRAERRCERFHRRCAVWCERRHQWEWDSGMPGPDVND